MVNDNPQHYQYTLQNPIVNQTGHSQAPPTAAFGALQYQEISSDDEYSDEGEYDSDSSDLDDDYDGEDGESSGDTSSSTDY